MSARSRGRPATGEFAYMGPRAPRARGNKARRIDRSAGPAGCRRGHCQPRSGVPKILRIAQESRVCAMQSATPLPRLSPAPRADQSPRDQCCRSAALRGAGPRSPKADALGYGDRRHSARSNADPPHALKGPRESAVFLCALCGRKRIETLRRGKASPAYFAATTRLRPSFLAM